MKETEWVQKVAEQLQPRFQNMPNLLIETQRKLPYAYEILSYTKDWKVNKSHINSYATDLLFSEIDGELIKPRVVIEAKILSITTHDAITYSQKATTHKSIHPYLRYGIMLGNRGKYPLPGRLFRHGSNFDFMTNFTGYNLSEDELNAFADLINCEIQISRDIEEMFFSSRSAERKRYCALQKKLGLWE